MDQGRNYGSVSNKNRASLFVETIPETIRIEEANGHEVDLVNVFYDPNKDEYVAVLKVTVP